MSTLQSLIEGGGECGAANPVVELARQFTAQSSSAAEDPTASLIRDIHHPETLLGQQGHHGQQQQQPIGASFSAAAHLLSSNSRSSAAVEQQQNQQQSSSAPFDMVALLESMREMDSQMERAMKRGHDLDQDPDLGDFVEEAEPAGKLSGTGDPLLCSGAGLLEDLDSGWEEALKLANNNASSSSLLDATGFEATGSSSAAIDDSWEEALLASVGTPAVLPGGGNNWVDEYFRTLDARLEGIEEREESARPAENGHGRRRRSCQP